MITNPKLIEQLREVNKTVSYERIAKALNVSSQSVYRWLKQGTEPTALALEKIEQFVSKK